MSTKTLLIQGHNAGGDTRRVKVTATTTDSSGAAIDCFDGDGAIIEPKVGYLAAADGELLLPLVPNAQFTRPVSGSRYTIVVGRKSYIIVKNGSDAQTLDSAITATAADIEDVRFDDLADVDMTGVADGDVPTWDDATDTWLPGTGGGGGAPSGAAGGVLGGTYPNPSFAADMATQAELDAHLNDTADAHAASAITNTPAGTVAASTVQAAIDELGSEKVAKAGDTMSGALAMGSNAISGVTALTASGEIIGADFAPASATGATVAARYFRGTATVAPTTGTWVAGDIVPTADGKIHICTVGGTPGTWVQVGGTMSAAAILAALLTVDGSGSGLDADLLDGSSAAAFVQVANNLSDVTAATAFGNIKQAATTSATGVVELATAAEINTGTDTGRVPSVDELAGSNLGTELVEIMASDMSTAITTGDGKAGFMVPAKLNGMNLIRAHAALLGAQSTSGTPTVQIRNATQAADMLSTRITIDINESSSHTAAAAPVVDTANDDVATGDLIYVDIDVAGTGAKGLLVSLEFMLP